VRRRGHSGDGRSNDVLVDVGFDRSRGRGQGSARGANGGRKPSTERPSGEDWRIVRPQDTKPSTRARGRDFWRVVRRGLGADYLPNRRGWRHGQACGRRRHACPRRGTEGSTADAALTSPRNAGSRGRTAETRPAQTEPTAAWPTSIPYRFGWTRVASVAEAGSRRGGLKGRGGRTVMEKLPTWLPRRELGRLWSLERHYLTGCAAGSSLRELLQGAPGWVRGAAASPSPEPRPGGAPRSGNWPPGGLHIDEIEFEHRFDALDRA
jgi:hypothetical protein